MAVQSSYLARCKCYEQKTQCSVGTKNTIYEQRTQCCRCINNCSSDSAAETVDSKKAAWHHFTHHASFHQKDGRRKYEKVLIIFSCIGYVRAAASILDVHYMEHAYMQACFFVCKQAQASTHRKTRTERSTHTCIHTLVPTVRKFFTERDEPSHRE
jgi:hypothetical protein